MKYHEPELHFISAAMAGAVCVGGSNASVISECTSGSDVIIPKCEPGSAANTTCESGTGNVSSCDVGTAQGEACHTGTIA